MRSRLGWRFYRQLQRPEVPEIVKHLMEGHQILPSQYRDQHRNSSQTPLQRIGIAMVEDVIVQLAKGPHRNRNFVADLAWVSRWNDAQAYSFTFEQAFYAGYPGSQLDPEVLSKAIVTAWQKWSEDGLDMPLRHYVSRPQEKKAKKVVAAILTAVACLLLVVAPARAYNTGGDDYTFASAKTVTASQDLASATAVWVRHGACLLDVTAASGTLDVYLQTVINGTDDDYCRFTQVSGTGKRWLSFSAITSTIATADHAVSDRSSGVTAGQCRTGPLGGLIKAAVVVSGGGSFTFSLICHFSEN